MDNAEITPSIHTPVLLHECVTGLLAAPAVQAALSADTDPVWYLDGTLGGGGHARAMVTGLRKAGLPQGRTGIILLDRDPQAVRRARRELSPERTGLSADHTMIVQVDYRRLDQVLDGRGVRQVQMIMLDLGLSSDELDLSGRGFSFMRDEPLEMTMGLPSEHFFTAKDILNGWEEEDIANVIYAYGEERYARRIARAIVSHRAKKPFETTAELAELIRHSVPPPYRRGKIHPATRTFQALRIAVNDELGALREGLSRGLSRLAPGGRMAVISFHSLEDRIVKTFMREAAAAEDESFALVTRRAITPSVQESSENPRSRSAKLRIIQRNH